MDHFLHTVDGSRTFQNLKMRVSRMLTSNGAFRVQELLHGTGVTIEQADVCLSKMAEMNLVKRITHGSVKEHDIYGNP